MEGLPLALSDTIDYFARFPGVGRKTALRMAFFLLQKTPEYHHSFANSIHSLQEGISLCNTCFHLCESHDFVCSICSSPKRNTHQLCVIESSLDLLTLERAGCFGGLYFVLGGVISPMDGIGPENLRCKELEKKIEKTHPEEVIIALSSTMEGEATASYLSDILKKYPCKISKMARGMPLGNLLQYTDENTLSRSFSGRIEA